MRHGVSRVLAQPTSVALQVAKHCHRLLEDYSALEVALTNVRVRRTPIRLGCFPVHLERAVFPAQLALGIDDQLEVDFSRVRQNRARGVGRTLAEELRSGIVDITFGPLLPGMEEFAAKPLYSATIRAVSPSITADISASALDGKPLCMAPRGFASRRKIQTAFDEARITPLVVFENLLPSTLIRAAEAGFGTALVPDDYAEVRTLNAPALIEVNGEPLATEVFAFWRRNEDMPSLKRLIDAMPTENS